MPRCTSTTVALSALLMLAGCSDSSGPTETTSSESHSPSKQSEVAWVLTDAPAGDVSVTEAKANAEEGDQIVLRGRIGGRHAPMSMDSPVFTVVDLSLPYCGQLSEDQCGTHWDYCCETPTTIASNSATIQVVGEAVDLAGAGLKPLDEVVLIGTVGPRPDEQVLTIRATGVYPVGG